jgi:hypothetical protein
MTHKALLERTTGQQAYGTKGAITMAKKDPEKVLKDLKSYRIDGDAQRVLDEIESFMDVESVDDNHATVKHAYLGFLPDDEGVDRLSCELATWEMKWDKQAACWLVEDWAPVDTFFQIDFTKDRIPWKKIRGVFCASDEQCAQTIASNSRFEREFLEATAKLPADEDDIYLVVADPFLRKALKPEDD